MALLGASLISAPALAQDVGRDLFLSSCAACHQPTGLGIRGAFPPLAGDAVVQGDPAGAARLVLDGRGGMPRFKADLTDAQIAAILTYVRSAWGNAAGPVSEAQVAAVRATLSAAPTTGVQSH